ncbi:hypothetical protein [Segetibacter sp.]|jgi:hypothetical protein|uniref:hypothetical protein n=1 Tax=Segetibacter sp. TaxID=2231182 RepID=UPI00262D43D9|nr:hypothetical protein [Segetibacter sp.]MCW3081407.1 hypothetical protein [Segetibacter sp.]
MKNIIVTLLLIVIILVACGQHGQLRAKIFERREMAGNRLMIRYQYIIDDQTYIDSATVANTIINSDSITVLIDPSNPGRSIPDIKEKN